MIMSCIMPGHAPVGAPRSNGFLLVVLAVVAALAARGDGRNGAVDRRRARRDRAHRSADRDRRVGHRPSGHGHEPERLAWVRQNPGAPPRTLGCRAARARFAIRVGALGNGRFVVLGRTLARRLADEKRAPCRLWRVAHRDRPCGGGLVLHGRRATVPLADLRATIAREGVPRRRSLRARGRAFHARYAWRTLSATKARWNDSNRPERR